MLPCLSTVANTKGNSYYATLKKDKYAMNYHD